MKRLTVADVMTRRVVTVTGDAPFTEIADAMTEHRVSAVPVVDGDRRLTGIVTEADLLYKQERKGDARPGPRRLRRPAQAEAKARAVDARGLMSSPVVAVAAHTTIAEAARLLNAHGFKALPVVGDDGRLTGIVARRDLLRVFHRSDADIRDEIVRDVLIHRLWQDPAEVNVRVQEGVVHIIGRVEQKSLIPIIVRMTAATEGVVDVVHDLAYDHDDTRPTSFPRA
ncbi:CBS domain-containing protein [Actinomadura chibensis]|uniref:CBS domain-containing protein n=1 Tax=Actinomadura chibensis TaxID=392828 RepID=A0A5D0N703_9ACTN|nr:CBS domain-containing protein [Actinomadura chibensis]TYB40158.1 CBS domain-containing protein [Actinomadura chibensis]